MVVISVILTHTVCDDLCVYCTCLVVLHYGKAPAHLDPCGVICQCVCVCVIVWSDVLRMTPKHRKCKQGCVAHGCEGRTHIVHMFLETHSDTYFEDAEAES